MSLIITFHEYDIRLFWAQWWRPFRICQIHLIVIIHKNFSFIGRLFFIDSKCGIDFNQFIEFSNFNRELRNLVEEVSFIGDIDLEFRKLQLGIKCKVLISAMSKVLDMKFNKWIILRDQCDIFDVNSFVTIEVMKRVYIHTDYSVIL